MANNPIEQDDVTMVRLSGSTRFSIRLIAIVAAFTVIYFAKTFIMPVVFAIVIALMFSPLVQFAKKLKIPPAISATLITLATAGVLVIAVFTLATPFAALIEDAPEIGSQLKEKLRGLREPMESLQQVGEEAEKIANGEDNVTQVTIKQPGMITRAADDFIAILATIALTLVLSFFLLISRQLFLTKLIRVIPKLSDQKKALGVANDIERDVSHYLLTIAIINTCLGILVGAAFWLMGMPTPVLFGVMAGVLNFLPYIGAAMGILIATGVAIISFDTLSAAFLVPVVYLVFTMIEGQFVTPSVLGQRFSLNTVVILINIAFWGFMWGAVGVLLAVPILIIVRAVCDRVEGFAAFGEFLSGARPPPDTDEPVAKTA